MKIQFTKSLKAIMKRVKQDERERKERFMKSHCLYIQQHLHSVYLPKNSLCYLIVISSMLGLVKPVQPPTETPLSRYGNLQGDLDNLLDDPAQQPHSQAYPCSSVYVQYRGFVYYTRRKPKNKKRGRPGNEATAQCMYMYARARDNAPVLLRNQYLLSPKIVFLRAAQRAADVLVRNSTKTDNLVNGKIC